MFRWIPYAMVRITAWFIAGILCGVHWPMGLSPRVGAVLFIGLLAGYFLAFYLLKAIAAIKIVSGWIGLAAVTLAGYLHVVNQTEARRPTHIFHLKEPIGYYLALVISAPEERVNSVRIEVELQKVKCGQVWKRVTGRSLIYISGKPDSALVAWGDEILVAGSPVMVPPPANPGEYDFRKFLSYKNITHQHFVRSGIRILTKRKLQGIWGYSQLIRTWASREIRRYVEGAQNQAIARALVLGVTEGIDNELQDAYTASGTLHVLSVSGLHVGIIYGLILFLLRPLSRHPWSRWLVAVLSLICLWMYAFITGMSPSVLRSVTMFSFIVVARPFARDTNIYNTLAASAFLLLLYDPYLILSVGFQLSYLAVAGIVCLQAPLYRCWEPASWFWDKVWQGTCVSLAAQGATFPLGLYYFHQFPVYFLLSNLVVIPLSVAALVMGVLLLVVSPLPWLAGFIGLLLQFTICLLNKVVFFVEGLPFSVINNVLITATQCGLLMTLLIAIVLLIESRQFRFMVAIGAAVAGFSFIEWQSVMRAKSRDQLIVYAVREHRAMEWVKGERAYFCGDSAVLTDERQWRFHILPSHVLLGIQRTRRVAPDECVAKSFSGFQFFLLGKTSVLWIDDSNYSLPSEVYTDYLIIGNDAVRSLEAVCRAIRFKKLILDSSNSSRYAERVSGQAESLCIPVHAVVSQGAFVINNN